MTLDMEDPTAIGGNGGAPSKPVNDERVESGVESTVPGGLKIIELRKACDRGWKIFPTWWLNEFGVCACKNGAACDRPGKHPRIKWQNPDPGRSGATNEWRQIEEWHKQWPDANWATPLHDLFVMDVDAKYGGLDTFNDYEENAPEYFGITLTQETGSGGRQLFYRQPPESDVRAVAQGKLPRMPGIEVRGIGNYCLIPPSVGRKGPYRWLNQREPVEATPHLLRVIRSARPAVNTVDGVTTVERFNMSRALTPGAVPPGEQDQTLFDAAASLWAQGNNDQTALAVLTQVVNAFTNQDPANPWTAEHAQLKWEHVKRQYPRGRSTTLTDEQEAIRQSLINQREQGAIVNEIEQKDIRNTPEYKKSHYDRLIWHIADRDARRDADSLVVDEPSDISDDLLAERRLSGASVLDEPETIPAVWGKGDAVLWSRGEGLMIASHQGCGKTTIAQQVALRRAGILGGDFLGLPVEDDGRRVAYLALDRPSQAMRSMRRMVTTDHRELLSERLVIWRGPLPINPVNKSAALADFIQEVCENCGTVVIDSVKDLAAGISKDEVGAALNIAWQEVIARGIELLILHHERKAGGGSDRHHKLDDVYGSTWLTSGLGSVIALDGEPGAVLQEIRHLKQPAGPVELTIKHNHPVGITSLYDGETTVEDILRQATPGGLTVRQLAEVIGQAERTAERRLKQLVKDGLAMVVPSQPGSGGKTPAIYHIREQPVADVNGFGHR